MTLEKKLVRLRKKEGMSQADVSEKLDVSRQAVSRWEAGDSRPSTENLQALCKLYNVKLDDLLSDSNEELPIGKTEPIKTECEPEQKSKERNRKNNTLPMGPYLIVPPQTQSLFPIYISRNDYG